MIITFPPGSSFTCPLCGEGIKKDNDEYVLAHKLCIAEVENERLDAMEEYD